MSHEYNEIRKRTEPLSRSDQVYFMQELPKAFEKAIRTPVRQEILFYTTIPQSNPSSLPWVMEMREDRRQAALFDKTDDPLYITTDKGNMTWKCAKFIEMYIFAENWVLVDRNVAAHLQFSATHPHSAVFYILNDIEAYRTYKHFPEFSKECKWQWVYEMHKNHTLLRNRWNEI